MAIAFFIAAGVAVLATLRVITCSHALHALLYFVVSLLAVASMFFSLGAPLLAALEVILYAGAIVVLFLFAVMLLGLGPDTVRRERAWIGGCVWWGPVLLSAVLGALLGHLLLRGAPAADSLVEVAPAAVAQRLFGPYLLAVELASLLLFAAVVAALQLSARKPSADPRPAQECER